MALGAQSKTRIVKGNMIQSKFMEDILTNMYWPVLQKQRESEHHNNSKEKQEREAELTGTGPKEKLALLCKTSCTKRQH